MPETPLDENLERMLAYPDSTDTAEPDRFVVDVMARVARERRRRRLILFTFGGIGALFGVAGAALLSEPLGRLATESLSSTTLMQGVLIGCGAIAFYVWMMGDDLPLER